MTRDTLDEKALEAAVHCADGINDSISREEVREIISAYLSHSPRADMPEEVADAMSALRAHLINWLSAHRGPGFYCDVCNGYSALNDESTVKHKDDCPFSVIPRHLLHLSQTKETK